tara:strand:+ start:78 stop:3524 length:3447 start_codon:yes stop_codon:yes gene_type:complete
MITLIPINKKIQETLHEKMDMLMKEGNPHPIHDSVSTESGAPKENYMMARTPFMRVTSFTQKIETETNKESVVVLMGGKMSKYGRLRAGFEDRDVPVNEIISSDKVLNEYGLYTQPNPSLVDDMPYRPTAGVKDISVEYLGGGMTLGATRTATMNWTCWSWDELNELTPHFLTPGRTVLLEWGWTGIGDLKKTMLLDIFNSSGTKLVDSKIQDLHERILSHIIDQKGHYDAMLGLIQNFDWKVRDDGGFDCTTTLVAPGISLLQKFTKNFNSKSMADLPALVKQTQQFKKGLIWDTKEKWGWSDKAPETVADLAPYITFKEYMADFSSQIKEYYLDGEGGKYWASPISRFQIMSLGQLGGKYRDGQKQAYWRVPFLSKNTGYINDTSVKSLPGSGLFVTWGFFEDNVLSRFFGNVTEKGQVVGEFRSFEQDIDEETGELMFTDGKPKRPIQRETRMTNSPWLITEDASKWVIPNRNDPVMEKLMDSGNYKADKGVKPDLMDQSTVAKFNAARDFINRKGEVTEMSHNVGFNTWKIRQVLGMASNRNSIAMRSIYFNVGYLQEKLKNTNDVIQGVMSVWEDFSSTYGGVYQFNIDYDDVGNRLMLREKGYSGKRAQKLLENDPSSKLDPKGLFHFPIWQDNSIVISNSLNGKLPDRMKLAAMYGANSIKSTENDDVGVQGDHDELAGRAWGRLQRPKPPETENMTEEELKQHRYDDLMSGRIDYPSRDNRFFGQKTGDPYEPLVVGGTRDQNNKIPTKEGGLQIKDTIRSKLMDSQKAAIKSRLQRFKKDEDGTDNVNVQKVQGKLKTAEQAMKKFSGVSDKGDDGWSFYHPKALSDCPHHPMETNTVPALDQEYIFSMQNNLRGADDGVMNQVDPLIPIDFEMEIDGTGGLFPGNSFQSNYLPKRYKDETLFQMTKVNHTIDSDGWRVSISAQMRAVNMDRVEKEKEKAAEKDKQKKEAAAKKAEEERLAAEQEAKINGEMKDGEIDPLDTVEYLDISYDKVSADELIASGQVPENPGMKKSVAETAAENAAKKNKTRKRSEQKDAVATMSYLQDQFNSGNTDWATNPVNNNPIVAQLQQTIKDMGYPGLPSWWGDGNFGPGTQRILGEFLDSEKFGDFLGGGGADALLTGEGGILDHILTPGQQTGP